MKKFIVVAIAVLLAIPAISFAGSATSRWDLTLGGYIKFDMGWADRGVNADYAIAPRDSVTFVENRAAEYDSLFSAGGEGRLWWIIKGPDAFGGKTSGYVEGDFRGQTGDYGEFNLRHAWMKIDWAKDSLQIGRQWQRWGAHFPFGGYLLSFSGLGPSLKGQRNEAIVWDHALTKEWGFYLGIYGNTNQDFGARTLDDFANSPYPFIEGGFKYRTDACGMIGPNALFFDVGGFYGWERKIYDTDPAQDVTFFSDDLKDAWGVALKYYVPIIPERKGNRAGALGVGGNLFMGQNLGWYGGVGSYARAPNVDGSPNFSYPHSWGGWFQFDYWFTNNFHFHAWYSHAQNQYSSRYVFVNPVAAGAAVKKNQQYIVNLSYDMNAAMRFGIEYEHVRTKYGEFGYTAYVPAATPPFFVSGDSKGRLNTIRIGAWYFF